MRTSELLNELAGALAKAQAQIGTVKKDAKVNAGKYGYTYATLATVMESVTGPLSKHGLAVLQSLDQGDGRVTVTTRILHTSGQWLEGDCVMPIGGGGAQAVGSAITYGRRYGLSALLGVVTDDDDDGVLAEAGASKSSGARTRTNVGQLDEVLGWIKQAKSKAQLEGIGPKAKKLKGKDQPTARAAYQAKLDELSGTSPTVDEDLDKQAMEALARDNS